ncbi:MAG: sulfite exporter TauE/SafE family protein [Acidobacteria bacterium]|nr:sulfite exporter TauE/SafE family protein [Acidobacteriota bacterium]
MVTTLAALVTFIFTVALTIAGVGAAFILIPTFDALGIPLREAMSTALLLNSIAMVFASARYARKGLVVFKTAIPILIVATALSPLGAYTAQFLPVRTLRIFFIGFLLFAAYMMLFYRPKGKEERENISEGRLISYGGSVGAIAGFTGGLLGVGGGNIIVPVLIWLGFNPKKASATTSFIVIFSSFSGFLGHATIGEVNWVLLSATAIGSIGGAILGSYFMTEKLNRSQVKMIIGIILLGIAGKMLYGLI